MYQSKIVGAAVAGMMASLLALSCTSAPSAEITGECHGINGCKGQGECGSADHECSGKNTCKGKGWIKTSQKECSEKGGKFKEDI